jgi:dynamin 1-like protein
VADTDRKTGGDAGKGVSAEPINLRIFSPNVLTLTLVDLPGITKVPVGSQPKDIERQIRDMVLKYITRPNAIILAVTAANTDLANSDGLKLAREVDPDGNRTIGVLTKIDLMDKGTDAIEILSGRVIPLKMGYVAVVNRGQRDIDGKKSIKAALDAEREFFENHPSYAAKAKFCGTPFLASKLNSVLLHHIKACLPDIKLKIAATLSKSEQELAQLGDISEGSQANILLSIITEFTQDFCNVLDGYSQEISTTELNGGARIAFVFHEIFANAINTMDPFDQVKEVDIRTLLYNSSGSQPALFVATSAFEVLIKQQIKRLEDPSLKCVAMVYDELVRILTQILNRPVFRRFPALKERFYGTVVEFFRRGMEPTNKIVSQLVIAESSYINTAHPDFISGPVAMNLAHEKLTGVGQGQSSSTFNTITSSITSRLPSSISGHQTPQPQQQQQQQLPPSQGMHQRPTQVAVTQPMINLDSLNERENSGIFGSFFKKHPGQAKRPGVLEAPPPVLKATGQVSEREFAEIEIIKLLLTSYYSIVKRTVVDLVPKFIMLNLVLYARGEMQRGLLAELYKDDVIGEVLQESPETVVKRKELKRMIEALKKAESIVASIA